VLIICNTFWFQVSCEFGEFTKNLLFNQNALDRKNITANLKKAVLTCAESLLKKLPMEDRILSDAQCLDPLKRDKRLSPERASRLTEDLIDAIGEENSKNLFNVEDHF